MSDIDPFEARLLFVNMLDNLNGAQPTIERVSGFALKNSSVADDLFDCIMEKLHKLAVTPRLNLFLVLDAILQLSINNSKRQTWVTLIKQELVKLVQLVIPEGPAGDGNVPQLRKVVSRWRRKTVVADQGILEEIDKLLKDRVGGGSLSNEAGMKYQDILKRIEQDRDRHKRHKVDVWIRPPGETPEGELEACWENCSDFNDDDWQEIRVDMEEHRRELA